MGYSDLGCFGSEIETPNIDRLAKEGLTMTQFYNCTRCSPSRASLLTGLYPSQAGIGGINDGIHGLRRLNDRCATIPELLKASGYKSYMTGKWHVGQDSAFWPLDHGFDKYFGLISGASSYYGVSTTTRGSSTRTSQFAYMDTEYFPPDEGFYCTTAYTDSAISFLQQHDNRDPFFLYIAHQAPHWPLHAPEEIIRKYQGKYMMGWDSLRTRRLQGMIKEDIWTAHHGVSEKYTDFHDWDTLEIEQKRYWDRLMAAYAATIDVMDQNIGRLLVFLQTNKMDKNTLIIFLSDNGACYDDETIIEYFKPNIPAGGPESYNGYGMGWANTSNVPFRLFKAWGHEGGISTPFIARYPEMISPGGRSDQVAHIMDILSTLLELSNAGYTYHGRTLTPLPSTSLVPIFTGDTSRLLHHSIGWEHIGNRAYRKGKWKIVSENKDRIWHLYNIEEDRIERCDSATYYPELLESMIDDYEHWCDQVGAIK